MPLTRSSAGPRFIGADIAAQRTDLRRFALGPTRWQAQPLGDGGKQAIDQCV